MDAQVITPSATDALDVKKATGAKTIVRPRLWEVDTLRGIAVVAMVFFHLMWDLQFFGLTDVDVFSPGWQMFARSIGSTFIFLMGMSLTLDAARNATDARNVWRRNLKRGVMVFGAGMLVTLATFFVVGDEFVRFGILHLIGVSIILATPFLWAPAAVSAIAGVIVILAGAYVQTGNVTTSFAWLIPFGIVPAGVNMVDYYPLLPWFGLALLGIAAGKTFYPQAVRQFDLPEMGAATPVRAMRLLGRHSLKIYLLHQPILIAILLAARFLRLI